MPLPPLSFAAVGLAGSSIAITSAFSKVRPAGFAHKDPVRESVGGDPKMHLPWLSALIATEAVFFPQSARWFFELITVLGIHLQIGLTTHGTDRWVGNGCGYQISHADA